MCGGWCRPLAEKRGCWSPSTVILRDGVRTHATEVIRSPGVYREQLFSSFVDKVRWLQNNPAKYQILSKVQDWFTPKGPAMAAATDCLLLVYFAFATKDDRVHHRSERRRGLALVYLRRALEKPNAANDDAVVAATDALGIFETHKSLEQGPRAWRQHARGLSALFRARGPQGSNPKHSYSRGLVLDAMHIGLMDALFERKSFVFGERQWQRQLEAKCNGRG